MRHTIGQQMIHRFPIQSRGVLSALLSLAIAVACICSVQGQDDDPFSNPFGAAPIAVPDADPTTGTRREAVKVEDDPVVLAITESDPQSPADLVRAIKILTDIDRNDLAKGYLDKLTALEIDDKTMFDLNVQYGSDTFYRLRKVEDLLPASAVFSRKLFAAADRYVRDPDRIAGFVTDLSSENQPQRLAAARGLQLARQDAVQPLMSALLDEGLKEHHTDYLVALARLDKVASNQLQAIAYSDDQAGFVKASQVMAASKDRSVLPALVSQRLLAEEGSSMEQFSLNMIERLTDSRPSRATAKRFLENRYEEARQRLKAIGDTLETVAVWDWDANAQTLSVSEKNETQVLMDRSTSLAGILYESDRQSSSAKMRYWISLLESRKHALESDQSVDADNVPEADIRFLETVLLESIKSERIEAAIAAVEILGQRGDAGLLRGDGGYSSPVIRAITHPNRRLQFAAMEAIMKWNPKRAYAGSSHFLKTAGLIAGTTGSDRVLLVEPNELYGGALTGAMNTIGFEADVTGTGKQFILLAIAGGDYQFAMISSDASNPAPLELMQRLRRDPRSAGLPLALVTRESGKLPKLEEYARTAPLTIAFKWPGTTDESRFLEEKMRLLLGRDYLPLETRIRHASVGLDGLLAIARNRGEYGFYKLLPLQPFISRAAYQPELSGKAVELLGWLATPTAQQDLVTIAGQEGLPAAERKAALAAFENAVGRRGVLLTKREILRQYDLYNATESLGAESQEIMAGVLDVMERRSSNETVGSAR